MYAVIRTGGKQYRVSPGDSVNVDRLDLTVGAQTKPEVLMIGGEKTAFGTPTVSGAVVTAIVTEQFRGPKVFVFKKKRRHKYRRSRGSRHELTRLFIQEISFEGSSAKSDVKPRLLDPNRPKKEKKVAQPKAEDAGTEKKATAKKATAGKTGAKKKSASGKKKAGAKKTGQKTKKK